MNTCDFPSIVSSFQGASNEMLAAVLDQCADCIKVIGLDGTLQFMSRNGRCALEIDEFAMVADTNYWDLWPEDTRPSIIDAIAKARDGQHIRFEGFCPTVKGDPRWWDVSFAPLRDERGDVKALISISRDISATIIARQLRETTAAEMKHRLQNAYTLTSAIVMATARGIPEREIFAREIVERLQRLGIAQSLLLDSSALGTPTLDILVRRLTEPFCSDCATLEIEPLPGVPLVEGQVRTLALVLGEFSTNSNKYGALGHGGRIAIRGEIVAGVLTLHWSETTALPVAANAREGSAGLTLIRRTLAAHGGSLDIGWRSDGLEITVVMPGF